MKINKRNKVLSNTYPSSLSALNTCLLVPLPPSPTTCRLVQMLVSASATQRAERSVMRVFEKDVGKGGEGGVLRLCVCVYVCVCVCTCAYVCTYTCKCICKLNACICICKCIFVYVNVYLYM